MGKNRMPLPQRRRGETDEQYQNRLAATVQQLRGIIAGLEAFTALATFEQFDPDFRELPY